LVHFSRGAVYQFSSEANDLIKEYFPCNNGYSWTYRTNLGQTVLATFEGSTTLHAYNLQIYNTTTISTSDSPSTYTYYFAYDSQKVYRFDPNYPIDYYWTYLIYPISVGNTWTFGHDVTIAAKVLSSEEVSTPVGTFECYKISYALCLGTLESVIETIWLARNVGKVKYIDCVSSIECILVDKNF
jgi:hypothetical protein